MDFCLLAPGGDRLPRAADHRPDSLRAEDLAVRVGRRQRRRTDGTPGPFRLAAADAGKSPVKVLIGLLAAGALAAGMLGNVFGNHGYTVTAYFLSAEGLTQENDVVINGARVGKVLSVGIAPDNGPSQGGAQVVLAIDGPSAPLHRGTRATIRPKGLLGNPFVELTAGPSSGEGVPSGGAPPLQDTPPPGGPRQVMDPFHPHTPGAL